MLEGGVNIVHIFKTNFTEFNQKVIVGTNIDTSIFTKSKLANSSKDLDYKVHFHYYVKGDEKVDSTSKTTDMNKAAFIYNSSTLLNMDNVEKENWKLENKGKFILVKTPTDKDLLLNEMDKLLNDFGVNIINYNYFDEIDNAKAVRKLYGIMKTKPIFLSVD
jgi:nitrate reductase NapAB chaperone NapD